MADPRYVQEFIAQITPYAVAVGDRYGIDPVTIITQAAVETGWGREVAGNNYFGVKSHGRPGGQNVATHEEVDGRRVRTSDNFRVYGSLEESVADYGRFLSENPRYAEALALSGPGELQGIASAGYATDSNYPSLIRNVAGMVQRNIQPLPPGSLPEVATLTDTRRPLAPPTPVTASPDMAMMRRGTAPTQLIAESFNRLPQPRAPQIRNAGDSLAMSPVLGGRQSIPMMDAAYDTRTGAMQLTTQPVQGSQFGASRAPAPMPVQQSPQLATRRATDPVLQTALNARYPAQLPSLPSPIGQPPATRTVQSVPVQPRIPQSFAGQERQQQRAPAQTGVGSMPSFSQLGATLGRPLPASQVAALYDGVFPNPISAPGVPARPGGPISTAVLSDEVDATGRRVAVPQPALPRTMVASAVPLPMPRPSWMPQVGTQLAVTPPRAMPPMPIARPGIGGPDFDPIAMIRSGFQGLGNAIPQLPNLVGRTQAIDGGLRALMNDPNRRSYNADTNTFYRPGAPMTAIQRALSSGSAHSINSMEGGGRFAPSK